MSDLVGDRGLDEMRAVLAMPVFGWRALRRLGSDVGKLWIMLALVGWLCLRMLYEVLSAVQLVAGGVASLAGAVGIVSVTAAADARRLRRAGR